jgi:hypothetical protein
MIVAEVVQSILELDQKAEIHFVRNVDDQLIYLVSQLPNNPTKVCLQLPTAIHKSEAKESQ